MRTRTPIKCANPVIIFNRGIINTMINNGNYYIHNKVTYIYDFAKYIYDFPYSDFSPVKLGITFEDLDNCYTIDPKTGEITYLYAQVPCNKCILCRNKRANEWAMRAAAETNYSDTPPLFITLTYNQLTLPSDGVQKTDLQNFFKRLRISLQRDKYNTDGLRYFAVAEYGKKTKRPHYHIILWGVPSGITYANLCSYVDKAWSKRLSKKEYNKIIAQTVRNDCYQYTHNNTTQYRQSLGFTKTLLVSKGGVAYVMKYVRKECPVPPQQNDTFYLSSRGNIGGIGIQWLNDNKEYFYNNLDAVTFTIVDKYTGQKFTGSLPEFYKRKLFPTKSQLIRGDISKKLNAYIYLCQKMYATVKYIQNNKIISRSSLLSLYNECNVDPFIISKFNWYNIHQLENIHNVPTFIFRDIKRMVEDENINPQEHFKNLLYKFKQFEKELMFEPIDENYIIKSLEITQTRKEVLSTLTFPNIFLDVTLEDLIYQQHRKNLLSELNETF